MLKSAALITSLSAAVNSRRLDSQIAMCNSKIFIIITAIFLPKIPTAMVDER